MNILETAINQSEHAIREVRGKCNVSQIAIGNWLATARRRL